MQIASVDERDDGSTNVVAAVVVAAVVVAAGAGVFAPQVDRIVRSRRSACMFKNVV
jgi:L-asparaginase/Glu-tRNA(Gln) amidotransferase subunit D